MAPIDILCYHDAKGGLPMNHRDIEKQLALQLDKLPVEAAREVLDFARFLAQKSVNGLPNMKSTG
jgi:hypothetical protein